MSFAERYNKEKKFEIDTTDFEYFSLEELYATNGEEMIYPLLAVYINTKGHYGDAPVFATNEKFVNVPKHMLDVAKEILNDNESIDEINAFKVGFQIYKYHSGKYNKDCYGIRFVDM